MTVRRKASRGNQLSSSSANMTTYGKHDNSKLKKQIQKQQRRKKNGHSFFSETLSLSVVSFFVAFSSIMLLLVFCLFVFDFEIAADEKISSISYYKEKQTLLTTCQTTCHHRLQGVIENDIGAHQNQTYHTSKDYSRSVYSSPSSISSSPALFSSLQGHPRRIPTLIKILTGFTPEESSYYSYHSNFQLQPQYYDTRSHPYHHHDMQQQIHHRQNSQKPIIARFPKPIFTTSPAPNSQSFSSTSRERHTHNVQKIAEAAATAMWKSMQNSLSGNVRMRKVNAEWDAALLWIATWDPMEGVFKGPRKLSSILSEGLVRNGNYDIPSRYHEIYDNVNNVDKRDIDMVYRNQNGEEMVSDISSTSRSHSHDRMQYWQVSDAADALDHSTGFTEFLDDLARALKMCIDYCLDEDDRVFIKTPLENNGGETTRVWAGSKHTSNTSPLDNLPSYIGNAITASFFSWFTGKSHLTRISFEKESAMVFSGAAFFLTRVLKFVVSSVLLYFVHSCWNSWASSMIWLRYSSYSHQSPKAVSYSECPAWLIEHEKEQLELMDKRNSHHKKTYMSRKVKRKSSNKPIKHQLYVVPQQDQNTRSICLKRCTNEVCDTHLSSHRNDAETLVDHSIDDDEAYSYDGGSHTYSNSNDNEILQPEMNIESDVFDDTAGSTQYSTMDGSVPSTISISTLSNASSSLDHLEDRALRETSNMDAVSYPVFTLNPSLQNLPVPLKGALQQQQQLLLLQQAVSIQKPLLVPTEEQRNEAAKQLREFQIAQVQRLLNQKRLIAETSTISPSCAISFPSAPSTPSFLPEHSYRVYPSENNYGGSIGSDVTMKRGQRKQGTVLKPPPGLEHPAEIQCAHESQNLDDFHVDNELLISMLLDDDDDDDDVSDSHIAYDVKTPSYHTEWDSSPCESALDPSAAPFILERNISKQDVATSPCFKSWKDNCVGDNSRWGSSPHSTSLSSDNGHVIIKGVYGGSVW